MVELTYNSIQTIPANQGAVFNTSIPCPCGHVIHTNESSVITLRGIPKNQCSSYASYFVLFKGNVALSTGATVSPISVAITNEGEPLQTSSAITTPAAVGDFENIVCVATINVPKGCCSHIGIDNVSVGATTNPSIDLQNAVVEIVQTR